MKRTLAVALASFVFVVPIAFAADPQPLVPCNGPECNACHLVELADRIIKWLIGILTIVGAIMLAVAGFGMVTSGGNPGALSKAKDTFTNIVVGFIIMLSAWLIIDTVMKMFVDESKVGPWNEIQCGPPLGALSDPIPADPQPGGDPATPPPTECTISPLPPITDPLALQMEAGQTIIWENTNPKLKQCVDKFIGKVGGNVTSVYRPVSYQTHLRTIFDIWCGEGLRTNTDQVCSALKSQVSAEVNKHFGSNWACGAVAAGDSSTHSKGTGVDISGINHSSPTVKQAAVESCLIWRNFSNDPYHYDLNLSSSCTCN